MQTSEHSLNFQELIDQKNQGFDPKNPPAQELIDSCVHCEQRRSGFRRNH